MLQFPVIPIACKKPAIFLLVELCPGTYEFKAFGLFLLLALFLGLDATARAGVTLAASPSPVTFGAAATLTATVTPSTATGKVTFYDGAVVLGTATVSGGTATLSVLMNASGSRSLAARYLGDSNNPAAVSPVVAETVNSVQAFGFIPTNVNLGIDIDDFAVADFNGDGKPDVAIAPNGNLIAVSLGNGDGTFQTPIVTPGGVTGQFTSIVAGDFNGDGKVDVAVGNLKLGNLSVFLGNGDGTFGAATTYTAAAGPMAVADFNLDGIPDLVVADFTNQQMTVLIGNGDGTFKNPVSYGAGGQPSSVAVGDVNGDGNPDLVTIVPTANTEGSLIAVLLGNGDGTFATVKTYTLYGGVPEEELDSAILLADFSGDGKLDLAIAAALTHGIWICTGNGDGTFNAPVQFNAAGPDEGYGVGIAAVDVNGDGKLDLVADLELHTFLSSVQGNELQTYYGNGDGTFQLAGILAPTETHLLNKLVPADFNGDGRVDLMTWGYDWSGNPILKLFSGGVVPQLEVSATHAGNLTPGETGATFTVVVSNTAGATSTSDIVTVEYLTSCCILDSMSGAGWNCSTSNETCSRSDSLSGGASYPPITITGHVPLAYPAPTITPNSVIVTAGSQIAEAKDFVNVVLLAPGCSFALSSTSISAGASATGGSVSVTTTSGCAWLAASNSPWLAISSGASGSGSGPVGFQVSPNPVAQIRTGTLTIAGVTFTVTQAAPTISPTAISPAAGSGATQTFTFTFTDQAGFADLSVVDVLISTFLDGQNACYFAVAPTSASGGYLYLVDDAGDGGYASGTPMLLPSSNSLENSQCTINGTGSSISASGNTLTVTLAITFSSGFAGNKAFYTAARSNTQNSGWQVLGTWNVPGAAQTGPAVGTMSPARSAYPVLSYTFTFTDSNGYADLFVLDILNSSFLDGINACYIAYVPTSPTTGYLYLVDDAGDGGYVQGSPIAVPSNYVLQNSQCTVGGAQTPASASANTLTLTLNITYSSTFAGNQVFYLAARNQSTGNSGWQAAGSIAVP